jgi:hypothetical protein
MDTLARHGTATRNPLARDCLDACAECGQRLRALAREGARAAKGSDAERARWRLLLDCAELCEATVNFLQGESVFLPQLTEACMHLCDECATELDTVRGDPAVAAAAAAARACSRACHALRHERRPMPVGRPALGG